MGKREGRVRERIFLEQMRRQTQARVGLSMGVLREPTGARTGRRWAQKDAEYGTRVMQAACSGQAGDHEGGCVEEDVRRNAWSNNASGGEV